MVEEITTGMSMHGRVSLTGLSLDLHMSGNIANTIMSDYVYAQLKPHHLSSAFTVYLDTGNISHF